jgi:hypothetical protein
LILSTKPTSLSSSTLSSQQFPPLCNTPPKTNKKTSLKKSGQFVAIVPTITTTCTNNNTKSFGDSKIVGGLASSSSPILDSNDLLTNTVNKVASGADISPTNQEENGSSSIISKETATGTSTITTGINKQPKQFKKKIIQKPIILCDDQKIKGSPVVSCISPQQIIGSSPPQVFF